MTNLADVFFAAGQASTGFYAAHEDPTKPPQLAEPIGGRVDDATALELAQAVTTVDPYEVETLLSSSLSRLANCISIREKAHEVQLRALVEAVELTGAAEAAILEDEVDRILRRGPTKVDDSEDDPAVRLESARNALLLRKKHAAEARAALRDIRGSGTHYGERFDFLKRLFKVNFLEAVARAKLISTALPQIYGVVLPALPSFASDAFLSDLALWLQGIADIFDAERDRRIPIQIIVGMASETEYRGHALLSASEFATQFAAGAFRFTLTEDFFSRRGVQEPLLRDFQVRAFPYQAAGYVGDVIPFMVTPPQPTLVAADRKFHVSAKIGGMEVSGPGAGTTAVHNLNPRGEWVLEWLAHPDVPSAHRAGARNANYVVADLKNFYLHMTVFGRR